MKRFVLAIALTGLMSMDRAGGRSTDQWSACDTASTNNINNVEHVTN
jgi:hypothetical protein